MEQFIVFFNLKDKTKEAAAVKSFMSETERKYLNTNIQNRFNLGLGTSKAENFVASFFYSKDYQVIKLPNHKFFSSDIGVRISGEIGLNGFKKVSGAGTPDFFVYKLGGEILVDYFFVEVKDFLDGVKYAQLDWFVSNSFPIKYAFLVEGKVERIR